MTDHVKPTQAPWIVSTRDDLMIDKQPIHQVITVEKANTFPDVYIIAICVQMTAENHDEAKANAALIAIAPEMLEALIAIQESAIHSLNGTMDANPVAAMISEIFEKLMNEAGA